MPRVKQAQYAKNARKKLLVSTQNLNVKHNRTIITRAKLIIEKLF